MTAEADSSLYGTEPNLFRNSAAIVRNVVQSWFQRGDSAINPKWKNAILGHCVLPLMII